VEALKGGRVQKRFWRTTVVAYPKEWPSLSDIASEENNVENAGIEKKDSSSLSGFTKSQCAA